jgi:manganese oxidase
VFELRSFRSAGLVVILIVLALLARSSAQSAAGAGAGSQSRVHTYYIAADEIQWNYLPTPPTFANGGDNELVPVQPPKSNTYLKAIYREYTDETFKTLKPRAPEWEHLGILGPLIRAEVGDVINIVFKNNTHLICTMHPHGLEYDKESEGAHYSESAATTVDSTKKGNAVRKGEVFTYTWTVPERAGPGPGDPSSILWMYHSHFKESRDMNSGLLGPIIVSRKGSTRPDGTPNDVDREFVVAFAVFEETNSGYFMRNIVHDQKYPISSINNPNFVKTLEYYTLNGFIRGTLPLLTMKKGERVRWYLMANSNEDDVHAPHWHGQTVLLNGMRSDTLSLAPMGMLVADMVPDNPGTWLFHCHVNDHYDGGMFALFKVNP